MAEWEIRTLDDLVALAQHAVDAVSADLHRTMPEPPGITVTAWGEGGVCIEVNDSHTAPSMWARTEQEAIAEVAEYVLDQLRERPRCATHGTGLHPEVVAGEAVWRCRFGDHSVAAVGFLGA